MNIAFGFGDEDAYNVLVKKDKMISDKMKKIDKAQFVASEFDKEMFLGKTFGHQQFSDTQS
jgi:hypothetical protein